MSIDLNKRQRKMGRPGKLTDEVWAALYKSVANNNYVSVSCRAANISDHTYTIWLNHAKEVDIYITENNIELPDDKDSVSDDIYNMLPEDIQRKLIFWYLFTDLKRAEAEGIQKLNGFIMDHAPKNPIAAITLLERRHPKLYSRREEQPEAVQQGVELLERLANILRPQLPIANTATNPQDNE